jgi:hypothetical protein
MNNPTIELTPHQLEQVIVADLQQCLERQLKTTGGGNGQRPKLDYELIEAFKTVLSYYMIPSEYQEYIQEFNMEEMVAISQHTNQYE